MARSSKAATRTISQSHHSKSCSSDDDSSNDGCNDQSSSDDPTTTHGTTSVNEDSSSDGLSSIRNKLSKKETRDVLRLKVVVFLVLILAATSISYVVYHLTDKGESQEFDTQFDAAARKIIASFENILHKMGSVSTLAVGLTSDSVSSGSQWPFYTIPNFAQRAGSARHMSGAFFVAYAPVVQRDQFEAWDEYVNSEANLWIDDMVTYQEQLGVNGFQSEYVYHMTRVTDRKVDLMHRFDSDGRADREASPLGPYYPMWQTSPFVNMSGLVNHNIIYRRNVSALVAAVMSTESAYFGGILMAEAGRYSDEHPHTRTALLSALHSFQEGREMTYHGEPFVELYIPVFDSFDEKKRRVVAVMVALLQWQYYLEGVVTTEDGVQVVIDYECGAESNLIEDTDVNGIDSAFTYYLHNGEADFVGYGDQHKGFDAWMRHGNLITDNLDDGTVSGVTVDSQCSYDIHIYPTQEFHDHYRTDTPIVITTAISGVFLFTILVFIFYDFLVERRQTKVLTKATQSTAIVSSLFPKNIRDRLLEDDASGAFGLATKTRIQGFLNGDEGENSMTAAPIADLFPNCTVFFADISGFTAWSSTREPAEVFILLQSIFQKFDQLAKRRRVFKVETIGDCYMAATGLPEPQAKHHINMVRFAWDCLQGADEVTKHLETRLGPDTADLRMRIGLHSGPVTAGVLRGDRARFQLFGDTVNTASRMESTGACGKIQVTEATAKLLIKSGKAHWLTARDDDVQAKGKGILHTYWVNPTAQNKSSVASGTQSASTETASAVNHQTFLLDANERLVEWIVEVFVKDIKKILHARVHSKAELSTTDLVYRPQDDHICLDEIKKAFQMSNYDAKVASCRSNHDDIIIEEKVMNQLRDFVGTVASLYRNNPFHNFEHACHVTMSVKKLLGRVVAPELTPEQIEKLRLDDGGNDLACLLHKTTYGINSEPLALVALTFSALIHDVDHQGISNLQLMKENPSMGKMYRGKSIAEQNSLDLSWDLFMEERFVDLRRCLFLNEDELMRFRQIVVNIVLATDIFDADLNGLRRQRWEEAFADKESTENFDSDLRATIVLEHVIQASDVSHTMQHWHVYQKWNKRLFTELRRAFKEGRLAKDPATFWYKGELGFFDNYIIPLAGKLRECGVFGVSSDEYLNYAQQNRAEWEERGEELLAKMVADIEEAEAEAEEERAAAPPTIGEED